MTKITSEDLPGNKQIDEKEMKNIFGGKRPGVKDSRHGYLNLRTSELLQRIERHKFIAILAVNARKG